MEKKEKKKIKKLDISMFLRYTIRQMVGCGVQLYPVRSNHYGKAC